MSGRLLGYVIIESAADEPEPDLAMVVALAPYSPAVFASRESAGHERDRLAAHARIDADLIEPHSYEVAEVRTLP